MRTHKPNWIFKRLVAIPAKVEQNNKKFHDRGEIKALVGRKTLL